MPEDQDKPSLAPETYNFTFSLAAASNLPAPTFESRPLFNLRATADDEIAWSAVGHQLQMREAVTAPPEEGPVPTAAELASRPIAQPRGRKVPDGHGSKEVSEKNVERLTKENAYLAEQIKRERARFKDLKQDLREEQITKQAVINQLQKKADDSEERAKKHESAFNSQGETIAKQEKYIQVIRQNHDLFLRELDDLMMEEDPKIKEQEAIIKELQEKMEFLQKIVEDQNSALQKLVEDNPTIRELQIKNNTLQKMVDSQQTAINEDFRNAIDTLKKEKEGLQAECDALNAKLVKAEENVTDEHTARRNALMTIQSRDETIQRLEDQVGQTEQFVRALEQDGQAREARIKEREAALKVARAEVGNLSTLNAQLNQDNARLKSQNENLAKVLQEYYTEIQRLQAVTEDLKDVESKLAEVTAGAAQTKAELVSMEAINGSLKLKIEEGRHSLSRAGQAGNLDHELSGSDFESISSDEEDTFILGDAPEITTPRKIKDFSTTQEATAAQDVAGPSNIRTVPGDQVSPSIPTPKDFAYSSTGRVATSATKLTQTPAATATATALESSSRQELTQTSAITVASISPKVATFKGLTRTPTITVASIPPGLLAHQTLTQTPVIPVVSLAPGAGIFPDITLSQVATVAAIDTSEIQPAVIAKNHSPLVCWLQVYRDLWILLFFWLNSYLNNTHLDARDESTASTERGRAGVARQVTALQDVPSAAVTTEPILSGFEEAKTKTPDTWATIMALLFHLLFYATVIFSISNYWSTLHERSIWLQANDITRQYFQDIYKIPFEPDYNIYRQMLGQVEFFDLLRYYVHIWTKVGRSIPG